MPRGERSTSSLVTPLLRHLSGKLRPIRSRFLQHLLLLLRGPGPPYSQPLLRLLTVLGGGGEGRGRCLISRRSLSLMQTLRGNVSSSTSEERWKQIDSTLKGTFSWINTERGGLWFFNRTRKNLKKARAGQHQPLSPFSFPAPKGPVCISEWV